MNLTDGSGSRVSRRQYLTAATGTAIGLLTAGTTVTGETQDQDLPPVFAGSAEMQKQLREQGSEVSVSVLANPDDTLYIGYSTDQDTVYNYTPRIKAVASAYAEFVSNYPFQRLEAAATEDGMSPSWTWYIRPDWAREYNSESISKKEYLNNIGETISDTDDWSDDMKAVAQGATEIANIIAEQGYEPTVREQFDLGLNAFYTSKDPSDTLLTDLRKTEINVFAYSYATLLHQGYPLNRFDIMFTTGDWVHLGRLYIKREWAVAYLNSEIDEEEYQSRIYRTVEPYKVKCHPRQC